MKIFFTRILRIISAIFVVISGLNILSYSLVSKWQIYKDWISNMKIGMYTNLIIESLLLLLSIFILIFGKRIAEYLLNDCNEITEISMLNITRMIAILVICIGLANVVSVNISHTVAIANTNHDYNFSTDSIGFSCNIISLIVIGLGIYALKEPGKVYSIIYKNDDIVENNNEKR